MLSRHFLSSIIMTGSAILGINILTFSGRNIICHIFSSHDKCSQMKHLISNSRGNKFNNFWFLLCHCAFSFWQISSILLLFISSCLSSSPCSLTLVIAWLVPEPPAPIFLMSCHFYKLSGQPPLFHLKTLTY